MSGSSSEQAIDLTEFDWLTCLKEGAKKMSMRELLMMSDALVKSSQQYAASSDPEELRSYNDILAGNQQLRKYAAISIALEHSTAALLQSFPKGLLESAGFSNRSQNTKPTSHSDHAGEGQ